MKHNIIKTENYLLAVDDSEIKERDYCLADIGGFYSVVAYNRAFTKHYYKKITAHLPLNNSPVLEGVDLLPPYSRHQENGVEEYAESCNQLYKEWLITGYKSGYNKAKEKYKYTEEDLRKVIDMARETLEYDENRGWYNTKSEDKIIQSLQQPKMPVAFECEIFEAKDLKSVDGDWLKLGQPKTTTNPKGQTVLVGKYIY
jgi:hypothetical protein